MPHLSPLIWFTLFFLVWLFYYFVVVGVEGQNFSFKGWFYIL